MMDVMDWIPWILRTSGLRHWTEFEGHELLGYHVV
jgi:hypothetical protein